VLMATTRISTAGVLVKFGSSLVIVAATCGCAIQYSWGPFGGGPRSLPSPTGQPPVCTHRRQVLDPVCYGYRQTRWMAWPGACPACPLPESVQQEPSDAPEKYADELPQPKLAPPADKTLPEPPLPPKQTPEPAPVPPEPMPTTEPGPLGLPAVPIPLNGANNKQKPKQSSPDHHQQNGAAKNGTPEKPAEKPSPIDEEPVPPKPPMSEGPDQSQARAAGVRDGAASATTNRTSTVPQDTGPKALANQQPAQRRTTDIAVRLSQSRAGESGTSPARAEQTPRQSSQPGQGDWRTMLERRGGPVHEQQAVQNIAQPRSASSTTAFTAYSTEISSRNPTSLALRDSKQRDSNQRESKEIVSQAGLHRSAAVGDNQRSGAAKAEVVPKVAPKVATEAGSAKRPDASSAAAGSSSEQRTLASSGVRNPNLPTLAERLREQAALAHRQSVSASPTVAAAQPAGGPAQQVQQPAASASATKPGSSQLARTQTAATQSLAAPLPPPLRTLGDSNSAVRLPTDGKVAAAKPDLLLFGYRTGEK